MTSKLLAIAASLVLTGSSLAGNDSKPLGEPVLDAPTLRSLGGYWIIQGDDNANATVALSYRKAGDSQWTTGLPLMRVEKGAHDPKTHGGGEASKIDVPKDAWLFAGSALLLSPNTEYELKLALNDPDGGLAEHTLKARTAAEPVDPTNAPVKYITPGTGGGSGTKADPFKGLKGALKAAQPGDVLLLAAGTYDEHPLAITTSGEPGKPIIIRGVDTESVVIKGGDVSAAGIDLRKEREAEKNNEKVAEPGFVERVIEAQGIHDVWFENLSVINGRHAIVAHDSCRIVVRNCHIHDVFFGFTATKNAKDQMTGMFILDNVIEGVSKWPRTKETGIEDSRGIQITGSGNVIAWNTIRRFGDAMDTFGSPRCEAIDFHNNDIELCTDDGMETDYSQHNTRVFENRFTNCFQGISTQPVFGGPVYIFRNTLYNIVIEPFKLHNDPSGVVIAHNTIVKQTVPWELQSPKTGMHNVTFRNNLFLGNKDNYNLYMDCKELVGCDLDYDGFGMLSSKQFLRFNKQKFATMDDAKEKAPFYKHAVLVDPKAAFASGLLPPEDNQKELPAVDLRLGENSGAVDKGVAIPGLNDGFNGWAPDLGAYELGQELPHYGPRKK